MHLSNESLLIIILVGVVAGWLAGQVMQGTGFGLVGDLIVGLLGARPLCLVVMHRRKPSAVS
jgi:uncharacterized membrane protein YeaQ/YmgE (transglycosylase-associated protein family)